MAADGQLQLYAKDDKIIMGHLKSSSCHNYYTEHVNVESNQWCILGLIQVFITSEVNIINWIRQGF